MELKDLWDEIKADGFGEDQGPASEVLATVRTASRHPLEQLRRRLFQKFIWGIAASVVMLLLIALAVSEMTLWGREGIFVLVAIGVLMLISLGLSVAVWRAYKSLPEEVNLGGDVLTVMKQYRDAVQRIVKLENWMAYTLAFPSPALGALLANLGDGTTLHEILTTDQVWAVVIPGLAVAPFLIWMTQKLNKIAFGKSLVEVEGYIQELENLEQGA